MQRMRILSAAVQLTCEGGIERTTVSGIVQRAKVSRTSFFSLFTNRDDCLIAAFRHAVELASDRAHAACTSNDVWTERLRAGLAALLELVDEEPELARFSLVHMMTGTKVVDLRIEVLARLIEAVDEGRRDERVRRQPACLTAEGMVYAALGIVHARLFGAREEALIDLLNPLMALVVLPYLGNTVAYRELWRPVPRSEGPLHTRTEAPAVLTELDMRLTYRRLLVLEAIAVESGLSNVDIGERVGVHDQGQISKLLAGLARHGLAENRRRGQAKGAANMWYLTPKGRQVVESAQYAREDYL